MTEKDDIITAPATDDNGNTIIVTAFTNVAKFRSKPKYSIRVEISLPYSADSLGFPDAKDAELLETITTNFEKLLKGKNTAVLTGIYTGAGERNWVFYTFNTDIFNRFLNHALAELPLLPLRIIAENDAEWAEYDEMRSITADAIGE